MLIRTSIIMKIRMKKFIFSKHATKRAKERGIPEDSAAEVIYNSEETINVKSGRKASHKKVGDAHVVVIYEESVDKIVVVTILRVDRERLKRYGFSRI